MKAWSDTSIGIVAAALAAVLGSGIAAPSGDGGGTAAAKAAPAVDPYVSEFNLSEDGWLRALRLRSEALNEEYGLGEYAK